nr:hypothetical protein [Endozoicomonas sp.]
MFSSVKEKNMFPSASSAGSGYPLIQPPKKQSAEFEGKKNAHESSQDKQVNRKLEDSAGVLRHRPSAFKSYRDYHQQNDRNVQLALWRNGYMTSLKPLSCPALKPLQHNENP